MKVTALNLTDSVMRLFELAHKNMDSDNCFVCLREFGRGFGQIGTEDEIDFMDMEEIERFMNMGGKEKKKLAGGKRKRRKFQQK